MKWFARRAARDGARPTLSRAGSAAMIGAPPGLGALGFEGQVREAYTNKPFVSFYATKRLGGCVSDSQAIKLMKFAAS